MFRLLRLKIITPLLTLFFTSLSFSAPTTIQVNDNNGQPLKMAVVEVIKQNSVTAKPDPTPVIMDQVNKRFLPDLILITQGQSVSFPNSDNIRHHVYSFSEAKPFELKLYAGKPKSSIEFDQNGVVIVGCNIHDSMIGSIYIAKNSAMITDTDGTVTLDFDPAVDQVSVWHPHQVINPEEREIFDLSDPSSADSDGGYSFTITTAAPPPRDTFGDSFGYDAN
ncbi:hypothetical protein A9Q79_01135 [Methylophaga sp. 42_25_T18]|nr:hypothetical protein A9Q79_01135 [Methylophaga sp. 42_25_T18]